MANISVFTDLPLLLFSVINYVYTPERHTMVHEPFQNVFSDRIVCILTLFYMGISCRKCVKRTDSTSTENHGFNSDQTRHDAESTTGGQSQTYQELELDGKKYRFKFNIDGRVNAIIINNYAPRETEADVPVDKQYSNGYKPISKQNFIGCRNIPLRGRVQEIHAFSKWSTSVCQIRFGNKTATGFRVGSRYIMTAYHVVVEIISTVNRGNGQCHFKNHVPALVHRNVFCLFNYFNDFKNVQKYYLLANIHFFDEETDTAVLELADDPDGLPMPQPFRILGFPERKFTLFGHMGGSMEYDTVSFIIDSEQEQTKEDFVHVKRYNDNYTREPYDNPPYNTLTNNKRILFQCKFGKGASGSPGISVQEDGRVVVVTMLLCGYPDWYYSEHLDKNILENWPKEYCIEQGTNLLSVGNIMRRSNPTLHEDIFCRYALPVPDIATLRG